jgi:hypothetical protein
MSEMDDLRRLVERQERLILKLNEQLINLRRMVENIAAGVA